MPNADNLEWLSQLASLKYLDLGLINLTNSANWLYITNKLQSIKVLLMPYTDLPSILNSLSYVNFTSLTTLDLSLNRQFNTNLPIWLWNLTNLSYLNLRYYQFHGKIPNALGNLTFLTYLYIGGNNLKGPLPRSIGKLCNSRGIDLSYLGIGGDIQELVGMLGCKWNDMEEINLSSNNHQGNLSNWLEQMTNLKHLDLSNNSLVGSVPLGIGNLQNLNFLDLSSNSLHSVISEAHFANLTKLNDLQLSSNSLIISMGRSWIPPFQLNTLALGSCRVGPQFPAWLRWQKQIYGVNLRNTSITGTVPDWLWSLHLQELDLSYNQITGRLPLTPLPDALQVLDLSNNFIYGPLPKLLPTSIFYLSLSNNSINGSIPSSICGYADLWTLDLSANHLLGELPWCWKQGSSLEIMDLSNNSITGKIPPSMGSLTSLRSLDLNGNNLHKELPSELQHCKYLFLLDLGNNNFSGKIPIWIGEKMLNLKYLLLHSNMFDGNIPPQLAQLTFLQVLDLSDNKLSGSIPRSFGNFTAMIYSVSNSTYYHSEFAIPSMLLNIDYPLFEQVFWHAFISFFSYACKLDLVIKGNSNFSGNHLVGKIPEKIGDILSLESLDLSSNKLSGAMPQTISKLKFLEHLNLS
ncbi:uncharacterized protein [Typha angustifolia]|uniref:uncharacterized protein n=1 Tax=Typha angustifolia TaxID=59011 RepID=UPI003C2F41E6